MSPQRAALRNHRRKWSISIPPSPALKDPTATPRKAAFSQYANGYSVRVDRYRYTEWGENGELGNELYDHQGDPEELVNLAGNPEHAATVKRLSGLLGKRIAEAKEAPEGVKQNVFQNTRRVQVINEYCPR